MSFFSSNKISTVILWGCMLVTLGLFAWFYLAYAVDSEDIEKETSSLLVWLFIIAFITILATFLFSVWYFIRQWKKSPKKVWQSTVAFISIGFLFAISYLLGNGNPLNIPGYKGNENTFIWLKLTDMWLYSIYILLALAFIFLLGSILWSYLKKIK
ncbi:MAG: hypothetical protein LBT25_07430 [Candidatus Symbiothrix sp.]|jgi:hypothetical protein|nr:hypothetical protein [Candidatus Symbiothrix sp.]